MEMNTIPPHFLIKVDAAPNPQSVVMSGQARFTILTPRLIRMEWSTVGAFEERASQAFWFRNQPRPEFSVRESENLLIIETGALKLFYVPGSPFASDTLWIDVKATGITWRFGDVDSANLGGTARTLDEVDGSTPISAGLISRSGWSVVDDSNSLVFNQDGWLEARQRPDDQKDLYFFGYGHDYLGCLKEFNLVAGKVPMIPRYVLGNWWSRYWEYSQQDLIDLMNDFENYQVPLSVCIIDMDWHITKTGNTSTGWTGYTWNRDLFPDPEGLLKLLHEKGLRVALNLHPAEGVHPHEEDYPAMCEALGLDPAKGEPVEFDITNPRFVNAYFNILHHPQEKRGIDFWWMDWQQGVKTRLSGLDPLWWLNHLHFLDLGRDGKRRSFVFSRWGGLGNHRYPIGFSGDSLITWNSLAFQPYFTATASNVNYGWWSHDIGGHMGGVEDAELYARWVQMGVFLPVLRLHSTKNAFLERRPWGYDAETLEVTRTAMQLRHALIPYLYSMAWRYHKENTPPTLPMYYQYPEVEEAYACPDQYLFGDQLVAAPFIEPKDQDTRLSRAVVWLPEGDWYDFFTGQYCPAGWRAVHGTLRDTPVFAKAGAIVPQGPMVGKGGVDSPDRLIINVYPGADGRFDLYEDEGNTNYYLEGSYAITPLRQAWQEQAATFTYGPAQGETELLPEARAIEIHFRGYERPDQVQAFLNGSAFQAEVDYLPSSHTLIVQRIRVSPKDRLEIVLNTGSGFLANRNDSRHDQAAKMVKYFKMENNAKEDLTRALPELLNAPSGLGRFRAALSDTQLRALFEVLAQAGLDVSNHTGDMRVVLWNRSEDPGIVYNQSLQRLHHWWKYGRRISWEGGPLPAFKSYRPAVDFGEGNPWVVQVDYFGVYIHKAESN